MHWTSLSLFHSAPDAEFSKWTPGNDRRRLSSQEYSDSHVTIYSNELSRDFTLKAEIILESVKVNSIKAFA